MRNPAQAFGAVSRTVLWLIVLGYGLGGTLRDIEGFTYAQYILPGVVMLNILFASLQSALALVSDREHGVFRHVLVSPAPRWGIALGKLLGAATVATVHGAIPLLLLPLLGLTPGPLGILSALVVMFATAVTVAGLGVVIAMRLTTLEGFGSISNGIIQPLYFLSGAIFPLKGVIGGVGFLDIPDPLRAELRRLGVHAIGGGWVVELPTWLAVLVSANPLTYPVDLLRGLLLGFHQMPAAMALAVTAALPLAAVLAASRALR